MDLCEGTGNTHFKWSELGIASKLDLCPGGLLNKVLCPYWKHECRSSGTWVLHSAFSVGNPRHCNIRAKAAEVSGYERDGSKQTVSRYVKL